jgi:hypothetical protein
MTSLHYYTNLSRKNSQYHKKSASLFCVRILLGEAAV